MRALSIGARWALRYTAATFALLLALATISDRYAAGWLDDSSRTQVDHYLLSVAEIVERHTGDPLVIAGLIESLIAGSPAGKELAIELYDEDQNLSLKRDILAPFESPADFSESFYLLFRS